MPSFCSRPHSNKVLRLAGFSKSGRFSIIFTDSGDVDMDINKDEEKKKRRREKRKLKRAIVKKQLADNRNPLLKEKSLICPHCKIRIPALYLADHFSESHPDLQLENFNFETKSIPVSTNAKVEYLSGKQNFTGFWVVSGGLPGLGKRR